MVFLFKSFSCSPYPLFFCCAKSALTKSNTYQGRFTLHKLRPFLTKYPLVLFYESFYDQHFMINTQRPRLVHKIQIFLFDATVILPCKHDHYCHVSKNPCHPDNDQKNPFEGKLQVLLVVLLIFCCRVDGDLRTGVLTDT